MASKINTTLIVELQKYRRSGSGSFLELKNGDIMYAYNHFVGSGWNDDHPAHIGVIYSEDGGYAWTEEGENLITYDEHPDAINVMTPSLLRMGNGDLGLFYLVKKGFHDCRLFLKRSRDEGKTWSDAVCCIPAPGYYVVNNERPIRLSSGRIVVPANYHRMRGEDPGDWSSADYRGIACFYLSDDDGKTWREAAQWCSIASPNSKSGLQESGILELKNGALWAWSRTDMGRQYETYSFDRGETWTTAQPGIFYSSCSPLSMKRMPGTDYLVALWNPHPYKKLDWHGGIYTHGEGTYVKEDRNPLVMAVSEDDGKTWSDYSVLEDDTDKGFDYTSILFYKDNIILAYRVIYTDEKRNTRIRMIKQSDLIDMVDR